jgi:hypothetical protein
MMRDLLLLAAAAGLACAVPSRSSAQVTMSPAVKQDVQCFLLYAVAIEGAKDDEKAQHGASLAVMYFVGKLAAEAPGLDLAAAAREVAAGLEGNGHAKEIGAACDSEFSDRGKQLIDVGNQLQQPEH